MPNHPPRQLELVYVVINDGTLSILRNTEDKRVCDLSRAIQKYIDDKKPLRPQIGQIMANSSLE
ncbi:hypothetical protein PC116_g15289 [Phytophthora cactorum]|uniref:Uncharacterized protein n=1 Tax=Phytophthora cactorum TaxID=29920 RepID=A0A8T1KIU2_9STRA|nr:hypothetical protein PC117_g17245 [Phytophthora cactorum]KAG4236629.1 hypothetical protein PC116_g15289 [Phytophthora cactorum]